MPMRPFHDWFPVVAENETRSVTLVGGRHALPDGAYGFVELFCDERRCDCGSVLINVLSEAHGHIATISHWLPTVPRWASSKDVPSVSLDPISPQSQWAGAALDLFKELLRNDPAYAERLSRHRDMVRAAVDAPRVPVSGSRPPGRNEPCFCGSGRKYKKCCLGRGLPNTVR